MLALNIKIYQVSEVSFFPILPKTPQSLTVETELQYSYPSVCQVKFAYISLLKHC